MADETLIEKLNYIKDQKDDYIIPTNIRSGVTVLNVTGTLEEGVMTQVEYNEALVTTRDILGSLPYVELEYIQSTGTQYIDTNIFMKGSYGFKIKFQYNVASDDIYGTRNSSANIHYFLENYNGGVFGYGSQEYYFSSIVSLGTNLREFYYDKNKVYYIDNGAQHLIKTFTYEDFTTTYTMILFARYMNGVVSHKASGKIYSCKIYDENNNLILDLIPVRRVSDNEICMYDKATNRFFTNAGTGTFVGGPEKE